MKHSDTISGYTLVLAGGGAKGIYQLGAWKALLEIGIKITGAVGTSVGALNAGFVAMGSYETAKEVWDNITIDKIVNVPAKYVKNNKLLLDPFKLPGLEELNSLIIKNRGLDTTPLRKLIHKITDETLIRKKGFDLGLVTYEVNSLKPVTLFIDQIKYGKLPDYLLASATVPGFKLTEIDGNKYLDGALASNIPYREARARGWKNIIVIDISGPGINNRKPEISGSRTVYIKNSINMGSPMDFSRDFLDPYFLLGYLDTLKTFEKIEGIDWFFHTDSKLIKELNSLLFRQDTVKEISLILGLKEVPDRETYLTVLQNLFPAHCSFYKEPVIPLMEAAAGSLKMEKIRERTMRAFIDEITAEYRKAVQLTEAGKNNDSIMDKLLSSMEVLGKTRDLHKMPPYYYQLIADKALGMSNSHIKSLDIFFPQLKAAKIFMHILKKMGKL